MLFQDYEQSFRELWNNITYYYAEIGHLNSLGMFCLCALIFMPLAWLFPGRKQPLIHKGMVADTLYWFLGTPLIYGSAGRLIGQGLFYLFFVGGIYSVASLNHIREGLPLVSTLPVLLQAFLILLIMDFIQYWTHRMFHTRKFWDFHAIHHSPANVDWLTSARFHPVNIIIHSTCVGALVYMIGFSPEAWVILAPFNIIYSPLVHANVNWTYGPFRYFLASPAFHRWHHTYFEEGGNKNFAPTFPFIDIVFGTYYDPKGKRPEVFGIAGNPVSDNIFAQLIYPFRRKREIQEGERHAQV